MKIIIYGSKYGSAKAYAQELSNRTVIEAKSLEETKNLSLYDTIIYIGGVYSGEIFGLKKMIQMIPKKSRPLILVAAVGLSDPKDEENTCSLRKGAEHLMPSYLYDRTRFVHLKGTVDRSKLQWLDKLLVRSLLARIRKQRSEGEIAEKNSWILNYDGESHSIDFSSLDEITEILWSIRPVF